MNNQTRAQIDSNYSAEQRCAMLLALAAIEHRAKAIGSEEACNELLRDFQELSNIPTLLPNWLPPGWAEISGARDLFGCHASVIGTMFQELIGSYVAHCIMGGWPTIEDFLKSAIEHCRQEARQTPPPRHAYEPPTHTQPCRSHGNYSRGNGVVQSANAFSDRQRNSDPLDRNRSCPGPSSYQYRYGLGIRCSSLVGPWSNMGHVRLRR